MEATAKRLEAPSRRGLRHRPERRGDAGPDQLVRLAHRIVAEVRISLRCLVVAVSVCPSSAPISGKLNPALAPTAANECRKSWIRTSSSPAAFRTRRKVFSQATRCAPFLSPGRTNPLPSSRGRPERSASAGAFKKIGLAPVLPLSGSSISCRSKEIQRHSRPGTRSCGRRLGSAAKSPRSPPAARHSLRHRRALHRACLSRSRTETALGCAPQISERVYTDCSLGRSPQRSAKLAWSTSD